MKSVMHDWSVTGGTILLAGLLAISSCLSCRQQEHVFIDCGSYLGGMIHKFEKSDLAKEHRWEVIAFEANPEFAKQIPKRDNWTVLQQAVWIKDGTIEFYVDDHRVGSTVIKGKKTGKLAEVPLEVPSIDFSEWLKRNYTARDFVFVNLDIEGAEYAVLDKLLADGTIDLVDKLCVEFHDHKVGVPEERDHELAERITARNVAMWYKTVASDRNTPDHTCFE